MQRKEFKWLVISSHVRHTGTRAGRSISELIAVNLCWVDSCCGPGESANPLRVLAHSVGSHSLGYCHFIPFQAHDELFCT